MKRWWILGLLAGVFVVVGAVVAIALRVDGLPGVAAGAVFLVVGLGMAWSAAQMRREESMGDAPAPEAVPGGAAAHHVHEVRGVEVAATRPGQAITRDFSQGFELDAGAGRLTGRAHVESGRSWSYTRRIEYGVGTDGSIGKQVDIDFSSSEIQRPINEVLRETGWYTTWFAALPAEAKGGLVMGVIGGVGGLAAGVAAVVDAVR